MKRILALTLLLVTCAPARAHADTAADISSLLAARARAVSENDRVAFDATMAHASAAFRAEKGRWFDRVQKLGVGSYSLELDPDGYADLAPALRAHAPGEDVRVVQVTQRLALRGWDVEPTADSLFVTLARDATGWSVVSDSDLEDLGVLSSRDLWDFADVTTFERNGVLVISLGDERALSIATITANAASRVHRDWPLPWSEPLIDVVPSSRAQLQRILGVTFDLGPFVAFTISSVDRSQARYHLTGSRVYVQPQNFFRDSPSYRDDTLGHELVHLATRAVGGIHTPVWLDEGVAQVYGERAARTGIAGQRRLPEDWEFTVGSSAEINQAYARAANFVAWLRARFGRSAPARFYRAVGAESAVSFGTRGYHLDRASRAVLEMPFETVVRAWQRAGR